MDIQELRDEFAGNMLTADGFEDAFIGVSERFGRSPIVAYDKDKCIQILIDRDGMDYEEAIEFFDFNVIGAWVGDGTPEFITVKDSMDEESS